MKILISGSSGLIGRRLVQILSEQGHEVLCLVRSHKKADEVGCVYWNPASGEIDASSLQGVEAIIHLNGQNVASGRWTAAFKKLLYDSRIDSTQLLAKTIHELSPQPKVLLSASAMGFYGASERGLVDEDSAAGEGFLTEMCSDWEAASESVAQAGVRTAYLRFGLVLSKDGGALGRMLLPFRLCLGGKLGSGQQYMSWIGIDDTIRAIVHVLETEKLSGPVNIVAPNAVTNAEFTRTLGRVLRVPTIFGVPAIVLKLLFGEMADHLFLSSIRVHPKRLLESGFSFDAPELEAALRKELGV